MKLDAEWDGGRLTVRLLGDLDHHAAGEILRDLQQRVEVYRPRACVLDLGGLTFMDSSGIAVLVKARKLLAETGGQLQVCHVPAQAMRVLAAAGLTKWIVQTGEEDTYERN